MDDNKSKLNAFKAVADDLLNIGSKKKRPDVKSMRQLIGYVVEQIGAVDTATSRPLLTHIALQLTEIVEDFNEDLIAICINFMDRVQPKYSYFPEAMVHCCRLLAELYQADEEMRKAAQIMCAVDTEDQYYTSVMTPAERCEWRIATAEYYLAYEDNTGATTHIQKCRRLLRDIPLSHAKRQELDLRHKTCYSRILDSERKFLAAAVNYLELAQMDSPLISENDLLMSLDNAVTCAILAKAGGPRVRVLAMLYRDSRARNLKNFKVLEKMHRNMILSQKEERDFSQTLQEHHQARLAGGLTVLQKAVYEHNMLAAAQLYKNIAIAELALLLGVTDEQAEDLARIMIQEGRMKATIDQVDMVIEFDDDAQILHHWDEQIQESCMTINDIVDQIDNKYPNQFSVV
jgi:COP9 signalosome complex subunit 4